MRLRSVHLSIRVAALATVLGGLLASGLAGVAQANVYWGHADYRMGVGRAGLDGSDANDVFVPAGNTSPSGYTYSRGVAADGTYVYWADHFLGGYNGAPIGRANAADGSDVRRPFTASTGQGISGLAVGGDYLYWTSNNQDTSGVGRTPLIGGQQYQEFSSQFGQPNPRTCGVAVDDQYVYFANQSTWSIGRASLANYATLQQDVNGEFIKLPIGSMPCGVAVDAGHVYWGVYEESAGGKIEPGKVIGRANKDGTDVRTAFIDGGSWVNGLAIQGDQLYFSSYGGGLPATGYIARANLVGGASTVVVPGITAPWGVATDALGKPTPTPLPPTENLPQSTHDLLAVGCSGCGSGGTPTPPPVRPDFSKVWLTKPTFTVATWTTPLLAVAVSGTASAARASSARASRARRAWARRAPATSGPGGTSFNYALAQDATVKLAIQSLTPGRLTKGGACKRQTAKTRHQKRCVRAKTLATLTRTSHAGTNAVAFSGRIEQFGALKPGSYQALLTPSAGAVVGGAQALKFTIKRP